MSLHTFQINEWPIQLKLLQKVEVSLYFYMQLLFLFIFWLHTERKSSPLSNRCKGLGISIFHFFLLSESPRHRFGQICTFGFGQEGRLGHGDARDQHKPTLIAFETKIKFTQVAAGAFHSLALTSK